MPIFNYQARTKEGEAQGGRVEAINKKAAADLLQQRGFIVVAIEEAEEIPLYAQRIKFFERVSLRDVAVFSRELTTLFQAEVPVVTALTTIAKQTRKIVFQEKIFEIAADVEGGAPLSEAFQRYPDVFSEFYVNMVRTGETSGKLSEVFAYLSDHLEREHTVLSKVRGALIYPAFVLAGFLLALTVMMVLVVPQVSEILLQSGRGLPFLTRLIVSLSDFMRFNWHLVFLFLTGWGVFFGWYVKTPRGKNFWDKLQLRLPLFGSILRKVYLFRMSESLSTLIEGGLPITKSLIIAGDVAGNNVYKRVMYDAEDEIKRGSSIASALALHEAVPPLVTQMVMVGEQSGKLVAVLRNVAHFYQREVDNAVDNITSLIEPALIVVMGVAVGILVLGVLMPIYSMVGVF